MIDEQLREVVEIRFTAHEKEHELIAIALDEFKSTLNTKLETMNNFRSQIERSEMSFLNKESYDKYHEILVSRVNQLERVIWMLTGGLLAIQIAVTLFLHLVGK